MAHTIASIPNGGPAQAVEITDGNATNVVLQNLSSDHMSIQVFGTVGQTQPTDSTPFFILEGKQIAKGTLAEMFPGDPTITRLYSVSPNYNEVPLLVSHD